MSHTWLDFLESIIIFVEIMCYVIMVKIWKCCTKETPGPSSQTHHNSHICHIDRSTNHILIFQMILFTTYLCRLKTFKDQMLWFGYKSTTKYNHLSEGQNPNERPGEWWYLWNWNRVIATRKVTKIAPKIDIGEKETCTCIYYCPDFFYQRS